MKPLLRAVLVVDALVTVAFALLLLATPWTSLYDTLQLIQVSPAMVGQLFGIVLLVLAGLQLRAAINGALTAPIAGASGHALWACGVLMLVWLMAVRSPSLAGLGVWLGPLVGIALLLYGLINVRLAAAVRRRERAAAQGVASAERAQRRVAASSAVPVTANSERIDPVTGSVGPARAVPPVSTAEPRTEVGERREPSVRDDDRHRG